MNILLIVIFFYVLLISILGYGLFFQKIFFTHNKIKSLISEQYLGFYGLAFVTFLSMLTNIFVPHNFIHNTILHLFGFFCGCYFFYKDQKYKYFKYIFFISLVVLASLFLSKSNEDFPYYHLPYTIYLTENKLIFGMGHLNHGYNLLSSLLNFNSTLRLPYIEMYSFHFVYLYFLIFFNFFILKEVLGRNNNIFICTLFSIAAIFFNLSFTRIADYGTDKPGQLLIVLIIIKLLSLFNDKNKSIETTQLMPLLPLLAYTISLKAYFFTYILVLLPIFIFTKDFIYFVKEILFTRVFVFCLLLIALMCVHYFFATGCLIAPITSLCFGEMFSWARSIESMNGLASWLEQWAKAGAGPGYRVENSLEYTRGFNWVSNWVDKYVFTKFTDQMGILFLSFVLVFCSLFNFTKSRKSFFSKKILIFYLSLLAVCLIWFFKHPTLRYGGYSIVFLMIAVPVALIFSQFALKNHAVKNFKVLLILVFVVFNIKNFSRIKNEFNRDDLYKFSNFPYYTIKKIEYTSQASPSGLTVYSPKSIANEWNYCWDIPAPCVMSADQTILSEFKNGYFFINRKISK